MTQGGQRLPSYFNIDRDIPTLAPPRFLAQASDMPSYRNPSAGIEQEDMTVIIMAGGHGRRLWPLSIPARPKPFCNLFGEETFLGHSFSLASKLTNRENIFVVTSRECAQLVQNTLSELPAENIVTEPATRGTTAAIGLATLKVAEKYPHSVCAVLASDHYLPDIEQVSATIRRASHAARSGANLVSVGVVPTCPHTGYGYMKFGAEWRPGTDIKIGLAYHEKPDAQTAERYLDEKDVLWNTNIFVWSVTTILDAYAHYLPKEFQQIKAAFLAMAAGDDETADRLFHKIKSLSIDYDVLEKIKSHDSFQHLFVAYAGEWSDVGTFSAIGSLLRRPDGNSISGPVTTNNTSHCLLVCEAPRRLVVEGLQGLDVILNYRGDLLVQPSAVDPANSIGAPELGTSYDESLQHCGQAGSYVCSVDMAEDGGGTIYLKHVADLQIRVGRAETSIARRGTAPLSSLARGLELSIMPDAASAASFSADLLVESLRVSLSARGKSRLCPFGR